MKKEVFLVLVLFFLVSASVVAQTSSNIEEEVEEFVKSFVGDTSLIDEEDIRDIRQINQSELPDNIDIKDIDENSIGIFEVDYIEGNSTKSIFVVTYATSDFKKKEIAITKNIQSLYFGFSGVSNEDSFLESSTGVLLNENKGYVMLRSGSVTGISTSLDLSGNGKIFINVYKNGLNTGFHNLISSEDNEKIDYDLQSDNIITYNAGDILSVRIEVSGNVEWGGVVTIMETTS